MDPLGTIGIFMLGASAGSLLAHIKRTNQLHALEKTESLRAVLSEQFPTFETRALVVPGDAEPIAILRHLFRELRMDILKCDREFEASEQLASARFDGVSVRDRILLDQAAVLAKGQPKSEIVQSRSPNRASYALPSQERQNVSL